MSRLSTVALLLAAGLGSMNAGAQTRGSAQISDAQAAQVDAALAFESPDEALTQAVGEAKATIAPFLKIHSCLNGYNASSLNVYAAPGKLYPNNNYLYSLIPQMRGHDKSTCLKVERVHGWTMKTANTLGFEVVYVSEQTGASGKTYHEVQKQPNGAWLFSR
jgi:hypothetical protein